MTNERVARMAFGSVYPLLVQKAERKGRSRGEVDQLICWLTGYNAEGLKRALDEGLDYQTFFDRAPAMNPQAVNIKGLICGYRVEDITDPLMQKVRWLDKIIDELAKGKALDKIMNR